ncbi:unnamed protein product [Rotaria sp. Silwood1]|nr:unnamed protein product [Rotaria sp. Silwood1]CAF1631219.1 unnamed protein product [Rotaria sp. Silwood1]CAF3819388.1 unnamed protein product [Rotaria sp. Silwood1]CAF3921424.1 unnamed protein product [Rotaria sp. Silwood1]
MLDNRTVGTFQTAYLLNKPLNTNVTTADRFKHHHSVHSSVQQNFATPEPLQLSSVILHSLQLENVIIDEIRISYIKTVDFT